MPKVPVERDDPLNPPIEPPINLDARRTKFVEFAERWACRISFEVSPDWRQVLTQIAVIGMDEDGSHTSELRECRRFAQLVGWSGVLETIAARMRLDEQSDAKAGR
jgi:hypothetical protein